MRLPLDPALIPAGYVIVDLSDEPFDENPAHSGRTLLRATDAL
ncbi:hypothetical protein [Tessaracoccus coleopterorum]|nr:hypothetical protein [Tessaracoccus coleopterorum]